MPFHFAWVNSTETTFTEAMEREDEQIVSIVMSVTEGTFASLKIDVKNPRIGFLSPGRKQWAWLAFDDGEVTDNITPLFFGRLIGIPSDLQGEIVTLEFLARPQNWNAQRAALADSMRVFPYYDPVWFDVSGRADPDNVLEGYTKLWNIDPATHVVTATDILTGEDGVLDIGSNYFRDSLSIRYNQIPGRSVKVTGTVTWEQQGAGTVDLTTALINAFRTIGGSSKNWLATSFTGQGLQKSWPVKGDGVGAGWTVGLSTADRVDGEVDSAGNGTEVVIQTKNGRIVTFPLWSLRVIFKVDYAATRSRSETFSFTLEADAQALLTDPGDQEVLAVSLQSSELDQPIDEGGLTPIRDPGRRSYFQSDRGWLSIQNALMRARALLVARGRAVAVQIEVPWETGLALSCRKSARIVDARLPCGEAAGKIVSYTLTATDKGDRFAQVTIGCSIGKGGTVTDAPGDPVYVADGYAEDGWEARTGRVIMPVAGELTFIPPEGIPINDDGVDFNDMRAATVLLPVVGTHTEPDEPGIDIIFGERAQASIIRAGKNLGDMAAVCEALNTAFTSVRVNLVPLTRGPFSQAYNVTVSQLVLPKTIDLECDGDTEDTESTDETST